MRERITEISFDELGRGPTYVGSIVRLNESVNVLRIFFENLDDEEASLKISLKRADGQKGTDICDRVLDSSKKLKYFQYVLNGWCTAIPGDLKISFSLIYSDMFEQKIEDNKVVEVYPIDTQRLVTIKVDPAVGTVDDLIKEPNLIDSMIIKLATLEEDYTGLKQGYDELKIEIIKQKLETIDTKVSSSSLTKEEIEELKLELQTANSEIELIQNSSTSGLFTDKITSIQADASLIDSKLDLIGGLT